MTDEQINDLAREFGDYEANRLDYNMFREPYVKHRIAAKVGKDKAKKVLEWLLRRFRIVEKSKLAAEYYEAKFTCGNVDPCSDTFETSIAQKSMLERLFPDLGKEVEA